MINPMVCTVANELAAATDAAITRHTDESASEVLEPIQRAAASKKAAYQQATRAALGRILQAPEDYILVAAQPLQSFPCLDALDATAQLITRDDGNTESARRRASLGWAFARDASIATVIVRKECPDPAGARVAMMVAQRLSRMATPPSASVLRPTGTVTDVKLVKPTKMAETRITAAVVKTKLHVMACDTPWSYGGVANANDGSAENK